MKLLLDTHVLLWAMLDSPALPARFAVAIAAPDAELFVSAATVWEIAIKRGLGKLSVPDDLFDHALDAGCVALPVTWAHALAVERLPALHADPFDRLLIAQARIERLTLVSADRVFGSYNVALL